MNSEFKEKYLKYKKKYLNIVGGKKYCINNGETPTGKQSCKVDKKGPTYKLCELYNDRCRSIPVTKVVDKKVDKKIAKKVDRKVAKKVDRKVAKKVDKKLLENFDCDNFATYNTKDLTSRLQGIKNKNTIHKIIQYNQFEKKATTIPQNYKKLRATKNYKEGVEKYSCGSKTYIRPNNEKYKKIQSTLKSNYDRYYTLDNGGAPFVVCVDNRKDVCKSKSKVFIFKIPDNTVLDENDINECEKKGEWPQCGGEWAYTQLVKKYDVERVIFGRDIIPKRWLSGGIKLEVGNSILLQLSSTRYVYIGDKIYEFTINDEIIEGKRKVFGVDYAIPFYFSTVGNSSVPHPVLIGKKNIYFMLDRTYVSRNKFPQKLEELADAYLLYNGATGYTDSGRFVRDEGLKIYKKDMINVKMIHKLIR